MKQKPMSYCNLDIYVCNYNSLSCKMVYTCRESDQIILIIRN